MIFSSSRRPSAGASPSAWGAVLTSSRRRTKQLLKAYSWPGNVRELQNVIERALILSSGRKLDLLAQCLRRMAVNRPRSWPSDISSTGKGAFGRRI